MGYLDHDLDPWRIRIDPYGPDLRLIREYTEAFPRIYPYLKYSGLSITPLQRGSRLFCLSCGRMGLDKILLEAENGKVEIGRVRRRWKYGDSDPAGQNDDSMGER